MDIFDRIIKQGDGPLGQYRKFAHGYFSFPKLEGQINPRMMFRGKEVLVWSLNNYLGLANHPEVRKADAEGAAKWGLGYPMGARMMSGHTSLHEKLEKELAAFEKKEDAFLLNYGYQGMISIIDNLAGRHDVIVYDSDNHACIMDGMRLHLGKRFVFQHNDMDSFEKSMERATKITEETGGGILVITEGVFGMVGDLGAIDKIVAFKKKFNFRLLIDDAHGFGTMGPTGAGTSEYFGPETMEGVDLYFGTFAKSMAGIGGFVAGPEPIMSYFRYNMRSQTYAKSLPMPMVEGLLKRLELLRNSPELRERLWTIAHALQNGFKKMGFDTGKGGSPVTPVMMKGTVPEATNVILDLRENYNIFCSVVVYPVVPKGMIMFRVIPTAAHSLEDVEITLKAFAEVKEKLAAGKYEGDQVRMA